MPSLHHLLIRALDGRTSEEEAIVAIRFARREAKGKDVYLLLKSLQPSETSKGSRSWEHETNLTNIDCTYFVSLQDILYMAADKLGLTDCRIELTAHPDKLASHAGFRIRYNGAAPLSRRFDTIIREVIQSINEERKTSRLQQVMEAMAPRQRPQPAPTPAKKGWFSWF